MYKIVQINTVAVNGSTGRITEGIGIAAKNRGYDTYIAYGRNIPSQSDSKLIKIGNNISVNEHVLETRLFDRQGLASRIATKEFIRELEELKPDLIHLHNIHGNYLNYKLLFNFLSEKCIPIVWTIHDCWAFTGHCVHFTAVNCDKWITGCFSCPRISSYPKSFFIDRSKRNFRDKKNAFCSVKNMTIVPVSNWLGDIISRSFLGVYPIQVIQNGIDTQVFYPRKNDIQFIKKKYGLENKFIILGVATGWSRENGLFDFINLRRILNDNFVIVLVGVSKSLKNVLPKGIIGIERTDNQAELAAIYTAADIFINGSFEETFGLVTAEAMACGTPVIVYNSTACPEIVDDRTGFIVPVGDIKVIKDTILLYQNLSNKNKILMAKNCSEYIKKNFDKVNKYNEYVNLYDKILNNNDSINYISKF